MAGGIKFLADFPGFDLVWRQIQNYNFRLHCSAGLLSAVDVTQPIDQATPELLQNSRQFFALGESKQTASMRSVSSIAKNGEVWNQLEEPDCEFLQLLAFENAEAKHLTPYNCQLGYRSYYRIQGQWAPPSNELLQVYRRVYNYIRRHSKIAAVGQINFRVMQGIASGSAERRLIADN